VVAYRHAGCKDNKYHHSACNGAQQPQHLNCNAIPCCHKELTCSWLFCRWMGVDVGLTADSHQLIVTLQLHAACGMQERTSNISCCSIIKPGKAATACGRRNIQPVKKSYAITYSPSITVTPGRPLASLCSTTPARHGAVQTLTPNVTAEWYSISHLSSMKEGCHMHVRRCTAKLMTESLCHKDTMQQYHAKGMWNTSATCCLARAVYST
jgi:hypothetical protein